jgi:hypothetical protein
MTAFTYAPAGIGLFFGVLALSFLWRIAIAVELMAALAGREAGLDESDGS